MSFSLVRRALSRPIARSLTAPKHSLQPSTQILLRKLSSDAPIFENFQITPPPKLTVEMAEGIADATQFYVRHGISRRRLEAMAKDDDMPVVFKWQKMSTFHRKVSVCSVISSPLHLISPAMNVPFSLQ